jgi:hypothetical protein
LGGGWWNRDLERPEAERLQCRPSKTAITPVSQR